MKDQDWKQYQALIIEQDNIRQQAKTTLQASKAAASKTEKARLRQVARKLNQEADKVQAKINRYHPPLFNLDDFSKGGAA